MENERLPCVDPKPSPVELGLCPYCDGEVDYNITDYTANEWCKSPDWKVGIPTWKASISCSNEMCGHTTTFFYSGGGCLIDGIEKRLARFWNTRPNQKDLADFETWIRKVCFQEPTKEAKELAKEAWGVGHYKLLEALELLKRCSDELHSLSSFAESCDSWESFPSGPLEDADRVVDETRAFLSKRQGGS